MNNITLIGNVCRTPETTQTKDGKLIVSFSIGVSRPGKPDTDFFPIKCFGKQAEFVAKFVFKGNKVAVNGSVHIDNYEGKDGVKKLRVEVIANSIEHLTPKEIKIEPEFDVEPVEDDDLPFQEDNT